MAETTEKANRIAKLMKGLRRTEPSLAHKQRVIAFLKECLEKAREDK